MRDYRFPVRVYYEDTDLGEVVYYANYLKFIERGRTEMLRELGYAQLDLKSEGNVVFVVRSLEADYLQAARYDDLLEVVTTPMKIGRASFELSQNIERQDEVIFRSIVKLVCVDRSIRPVKIPDDMAQKIMGE